MLSVVLNVYGIKARPNSGIFGYPFQMPSYLGTEDSHPVSLNLKLPMEK